MTTTIIIKDSIKQLQFQKIKNIFQKLHVHGPNCPCHSVVAGDNSIVNFLKKDEALVLIKKNKRSFQTLNDCGKKNNEKTIISNNNNNNDRFYSSTMKYDSDLDYFKNTSKLRMSENSSKYIDSDYAFEMIGSNIRFGKGVTLEVADDLRQLSIKNVAIFTDQNLVSIKDSPVWKVCEVLKKNQIHFKLYDRVAIEPTDISFKDATKFMLEQGPFEGIVAIGGGSVMDTAKAANLYSTYPPNDFLDYVNAPIGKGMPVPGPVKPLIAIPTTSGTGSEVTGVAVFDLTSQNFKTGIAHRRLKPILGLVDPDNTRSCPTNVFVSSGLDQFCHSLESFTALPFNKRSPKPLDPLQRPSYQGSNPISDVWALKSLEMIYRNLPLVVKDPTNEYARSQLLLAATYAGMGLSAGVHLCHGMSYAISGNVKNFKPDGYLTDHPIIPHGMSVVLSAPAVFKFTAPANPKRHLMAAEILGADISQVSEDQAGDILSNQIRKFISQLNIPNGLSGVGYDRSDIEKLVLGTLPQHRVTKLSPRPVDKDDFYELFENSMTIF
ncbi:iron-containing alcohol dehydrogenase [Tieghemostelium lacteum]|uniref:hydroxyacid-oxoacid transhydrogenase n=1 Tax=Tieghemostelium lacteum TaxID=361077 RepID=A0A152A1P3_TIELA|nr:iron-containing alcohol dehydrogenase [Tieghemostelium lacteum]|eukprot:KYR00037.1 iron-containing alcohol dehydrogenase [Tieghemostelium lacteum]